MGSFGHKSQTIYVFKKIRCFTIKIIRSRDFKHFRISNYCSQFSTNINTNAKQRFIRHDEMFVNVRKMSLTIIVTPIIVTISLIVTPFFQLMVDPYRHDVPNRHEFFQFIVKNPQNPQNLPKTQN